MQRIRGFLGAIQHFIQRGAAARNSLDNTSKGRKDKHRLDKHEEAQIEEAANASIDDATSEIPSSSQDGACESSLPRISTTSHKLVSLDKIQKTSYSKKKRDLTRVPDGTLEIDEPLKEKEKVMPEIPWKGEVPLAKEKILDKSSLPTSDIKVHLPRIGNEKESVGGSPVGKEPVGNPATVVGELQQTTGGSEEDKRLVFPDLTANSSHLSVMLDPVASKAESLPSTQSTKKKKKKKTKRSKRNKIKPLDHLPGIQPTTSGQLSVAPRNSSIFDASNPPKHDKLEEDDLATACLKSGDQEMQDIQLRKHKSKHKLPQMKRWLHRKNNLVAPLPDIETHLAATGSLADGSSDLWLSDQQGRETSGLMSPDRSIKLITDGQSLPLKLPPSSRKAREFDTVSDITTPANSRTSCDLLQIPPLKLTPGHRVQLVSHVQTLATPRSLPGKSAQYVGRVNLEGASTGDQLSTKQRSQTQCLTEATLHLPETKHDSAKAASTRTQSMVVDLPCGVQFVPAPIIKAGSSKIQKDDSASKIKEQRMTAFSSRNSVQCLPKIQRVSAISKQNNAFLVRIEGAKDVHMDKSGDKEEGKKSTAEKLPLVQLNERPLTAKRPPYPEHWGDVPTQRPPGRGGHGFCLGIMCNPNKRDPLFSSSSAEDFSEDGGHQLCSKVMKPVKEKNKIRSDSSFPRQSEATKSYFPRLQEQPTSSGEDMWCQWNGVPNMGKVRVIFQAKVGSSLGGKNAMARHGEDMAITDCEDVQDTLDLA